MQKLLPVDVCNSVEARERALETSGQVEIQGVPSYKEGDPPSYAELIMHQTEKLVLCQFETCKAIDTVIADRTQHFAPSCPCAQIVSYFGVHRRSRT